MKKNLGPLDKYLLETASARAPKTKKDLAKQEIRLSLADPESTPIEDLNAMKAERPTLVKSILNVLNGPRDSIERLAFEEDPTSNSEYFGLYKSKVRLTPDNILKRIAIQDDLVAAIANTRSNQVSVFGRPRPDRFGSGFVIEPRPGVMDNASEKARKELQDRIVKATEKFISCGDFQGWEKQDKMTFSQYLSQITRNGIILGRFATEVISVVGRDGQERFHSFRPIDAGTVYKAVPRSQQTDTIRKQARLALERVKNKKLEPERFEKDEYTWVQVIDGKPVQAFTAEECLVHNLYQVPDVELGGYPLTPLDTVIAAVMTHINITTHNKLYFQSGRAARGMLVIRSEDVSEDVITRIRTQFNTNINSVANAWRMPVFGIGAEDEISWQAIDSGSRDMEFQFLSDNNARIILSAFQMSPEELPGYQHLSRGTNNQALSESNNEFKLLAARDVGIRPLISHIEDFINESLFPLIDKKLSETCVIKFRGLDAETAEKEAVRIQQDAPLHMTYNQILERVEKDPLPREWAGEFPLSPQYQAVLDKYFTMGQIQEYWFGKEGAAKDPTLAFYGNPVWLQYQEFLFSQQQYKDQMEMQQQQMQMEQQQAQAQAQQAPAEGEGQQEEEAPPQDLTRSLDQLTNLLSKGERKLPPGKRRLLVQQRLTVNSVIKGMEEDSEEVIKDILAVAEKNLPRK